MLNLVSRARLSAFIKKKFKQTNAKRLDGRVADDTSLLKSGLLDSLALLELVAWIEREIGCPLDLTDIDIVEEWDTVSGIMRFIATHQKR